jgi:hypothetical protein
MGVRIRPWWRRRQAANAFICGTLPNPHDRYGVRLVRLAGFAGGLALLRGRRPATFRPPGL